jgi:hypothetical protein
LNWFSKKPPTASAEELDSSGLDVSDATMPLLTPAQAKNQLDSAGAAVDRRNARLERRELLYSVIRECMTQAGILSQSFKFKVLSLDSHGRQYLVMMDLPQQLAPLTGHFSDIETHIARNAKTRHGILVTSVYWRIHEQVTAGGTTTSHTSPKPAVVLAEEVEKIPAKVLTKEPAKEHAKESAVDGALAAEMDAFKKASAATPAASAPTGELLRSGTRNPHPMPSFADTEINPQYATPLSSTQYGDLG